MNSFVAILFASLLSRLGYQMARSPVLPIFAADLGALPELIGIIVAASTITGVFFKLPAGALSDVLGRKRMMVVGALGVLTFIVVLLLPDVDRTTAREAKTFTARAAEFRQGIAEVFKTPPIFVAAGIEAVMYLGYGAFLGFLPIYAKN